MQTASTFSLGGIFIFFINGIWVWVGVGFGFGLVIYKYSIYKYLHSMNIVIISSQNTQIFFPSAAGFVHRQFLVLVDLHPAQWGGGGMGARVFRPKIKCVLLMINVLVWV